MPVQYRSPDITLTSGQTALPKSDKHGILEVVGSISPSPVPVGVETLHRSAGFVPSYSYAGAFALTKLYLNLNSPLTGAGPFYVHITDAIAAPAALARSLIPTPKMSNAGDFFFWEPPGGVQFATGIYIVMSTTPYLYTTPGAPEPLAVSIWTVP